MTERAKRRGDRVAASFPAVPDSVPRARRAVVDLAIAAGASAARVDAIRLATSEALTNAILHAYGGAPGHVHVSAELDRGELVVVVADDGRGLTPRVKRRGMGLGLVLIAEAADEMAIAKRRGGGTEVQMRFAVSPRS